MKKILIAKLNFLARLIIRRFKPQIVGITGSVGKTSTKEAIYCVLKHHFDVRANTGSYNNEFGLPLTILGASAPGKNLFKWIGLLFKALLILLGNKYPKILILEMGADRSGDIQKLLAVTGGLQVAVITDIGVSHLQNYPNQKSLTREKLSILKGLNPDGVAVVNLDNEHLAEAWSGIKQNKFGYGFNQADIQATDFQVIKNQDSFGINFKVHHKGNVVPFFIPNCLGQPTTYSALAACGVALAFKLNLVNVSDALREFEAPAGRLRYMPGVKHTFIIDDTYNAAPTSTLAALTVLTQIAPTRKLAAIGDMAELGTETEAGHKQVAHKIVELGLDSVFLVGQKGKIIFEELNAVKFPGESFWFADSDQAKMPVQNHLQPGDTILVKGSQAVRMEKIVLEIMADPLNAPNLLVRQSAKWQKM